MVRNLPYNHVFSIALLTGLAGGCGDGDEHRRSESSSNTLDNSADGGSDAPCEPLTPGKLDLLFVLDNSGSMAQEQARLQEQIPALLAMLSSGQGRDGTTFTPIHDLHIGVTTADMGLSGSTTVLPPFCGGTGDDGYLLTGRTPNPCTSTQRSIDPIDCTPGPWAEEPEPVPGFFSYETPESDLLSGFQVGVMGCGLEQHLDAMYKALAPSSVAFPSNLHGHGDGVNAGFLRDDAALAVVILSDEDDCSVTDAGMAPLFDDNSNDPSIMVPGSSMRLGLNVRCSYRHDPAARVSQVEQAGFIQPPSRYFSDFAQNVKPNHPESVAFIAIVGIPDGTEGLSPEAILAHPGMDFATDPATGGGDPTNRNTAPRDACRRCASKSPQECMNEPVLLPVGEPNPELLTSAKPAVRLVQVAQGFGDSGLVRSICAESYAPAIDGLVQKVALLQATAARLGDSCAP